MKTGYKEHKINNVDELRLEIVRLKLVAKSQEAYLETQYDLLKRKVDAPFRFLSNTFSWIPGVDVARELLRAGDGKGKKDWVSRIFSAGSTALLNRLFLRKAGLFKRVLLSTVTQQAAGMMNQERVSSLIKSVADLIRPSKNGAHDEQEAYDQEAFDEETYKKTRGRKKKRRSSRAAASAAAADPAKAPDFGIPPDSEAS